MQQDGQRAQRRTHGAVGQVSHLLERRRWSGGFSATHAPQQRILPSSGCRSAPSGSPRQHWPCSAHCDSGMQATKTRLLRRAPVRDDSLHAAARSAKLAIDLVRRALPIPGAAPSPVCWYKVGSSMRTAASFSCSQDWRSCAVKSRGLQLRFGKCAVDPLIIARPPTTGLHPRLS